MDRENIEEILKSIGGEDVPAEVRKIAEEASANFGKTLIQTKQPKHHVLWEYIMASKITKLAAAAVIIIAMVFSISLWDKSIPAAYAIEQTIEAFKKVNLVYVEQIIREKGTSANVKMWARRGVDGNFFFGDFRQEAGPGDTLVASENENLTYYYNPSTKQVYIYEGLTVTIGSFLDKNYYLCLQEEMENVEIEYAKDEVTGKDIVLLTYKEPSWYQSKTKCGVFTFDLETKLPIRWQGWDNPDFKGEPCLEWTLIQYNPPLPGNTFEFEIPEDATVIIE